MGRIGVGDGPLFVATGRGVGAIEADVQRVGKVRLHTRLPHAATTVGQRHAGRDVDPCHGRRGEHLGLAAAVGHKAEHQRLEVHQQAIGRGVVGAQRLVVEGSGVVRRQREHRVVQDHVATHHAHALFLDVGHQVLQALDDQLGVAAATDDEVAVQHPVLDRAIGVDARAPQVVRTQHVQARVSGHQLHHRGGVALHLGLPVQARRGLRERRRLRIGVAGWVGGFGFGVHGARRGRQRRHHHADGISRHLGGCQRLRHAGRQALRQGQRRRASGEAAHAQQAPGHGRNALQHGGLV